MLNALVGLVVVTLVLVLVVLMLLLRRGAAGGAAAVASLSEAQLALRLGESEQRLRGGVAESRHALESALRELQGQGAQHREQQTLALSTGLGRALAEAQAAQETRLQRLATTVGELASTHAQGQTELRGLLAEAFLQQQQAIVAAGQRQEATLQTRLDAVAERTVALQAATAASFAQQQQALMRLGQEQQQTLQTRLDAVTERLGLLTAASSESLAVLRTELTAAQVQLAEKLVATAKATEDALHARLAEIRADNTEKLEKMRATVEEKLQTTLEARLGESFRTVTEQLEKVHKGLGEMQSLATGVGDLRRVLTNVKSRGIFGEVQLAALLEDVLAPEQFARDVPTTPGSAERVDFAVRLPGPEDGSGAVLLPIDAKFPTEDYVRLQEAYEAADPAAVLVAQAALRVRILGEAKSIALKYVAPPHTTDFALLYLCTEGLYAESLRIPGLFDEVQKLRVTLVGPTTLAAFLNSLRAGFRTLAIQKRSGEVWRVLGAVKYEFGKFGAVVDAVSKKLDDAQKKLGDLSTRKRAVERKLREAEALPEAEALALLPPSAVEPGVEPGEEEE